MIVKELLWWITAIDIPAMSALFWLIWRTRKDSEKKIDELKERLEFRSNQLREGLYAFKLEVAKSYAKNGEVKELEQRLVGHLLRIESKLDATALKTESLKAKQR